MIVRQLLPLLAALAVQRASAQDCDSFKCHHDSKCTTGDADFGKISKHLSGSVDFLKVTSKNGNHCECSNAKHTGVQCDIPQEICPDGKTACFYGGTCREGKNGNYHCDCTSTTDGIFAAGRYCEHKASAMCDASKDGLETESWFCTNGGTCNHNAKDINDKCECKDGFTGVVCEFKSDDAEAPKQEECDLSCKRGGQCVHGFKDHGDSHSHIEDLYFTKKKEIDGMHCICPDGYAGVQCEVKLDKCGGKYCYHGATCITAHDDFGGGKKFCDCTTATDVLDAGALFAGKYCEAKSTKICDAEEGRLPHFCTNGGKCHKQAHMGCECEGNFKGPFCEYKGKEPKCNLKCKHGGQCRHGINNHFERGELDKKFDLGDAFDLGHLNFEYCSCPEGFYGIDCSMKVKKCGPDGDHVCANDGVCVATGTNRDTGKVKWGCDCKGGTWAGQYCEHPASQLCVQSGDPIEAGNKQAFCVNGGTCASYIDKHEASHPGCDCPVGFHGRRCQYKNGIDVVEEISTPKAADADETSSASSSSAPGSASKSGGGGNQPVVVVIIIAAVGAVLVVLAFARRKISKSLFGSGKEADFSDAPTVGSLSPAKSEGDDGEFKEVHMI